jgi:hypothetical protein
LRSLVGRLGAERFLERHWPEEFARLHGGPGLVEELFRIPEIRSVLSLLAVTRNGLQVWSSRRAAFDIQVSAEAAKGLYESGLTLFFTGVERNVPALRPLTERLAADLGLDPARLTVEAFAARNGGVVGMHFDPVYSFNVQLRGQKRWWVARNTQFVHPLSGYNARLEPSDELTDLGFRPPRSFPQRHVSFVTRPGSVVWLPGGWWHKTRILPGEHSLCVVFSVVQKTWARAAAQLLERELLLQPVWRRLAIGPSEHKPLLRRLERETAALVATLGRATAAVNPESLISHGVPSYLGSRWVFLSRARSARVRVQRHSGSATVIVITRPNAAAVRVQVDDPSMARLVPWVLRHRRGFQGAQALEKGRPSPPERVAVALRRLVAAGLLTRRARSS